MFCGESADEQGEDVDGTMLKSNLSINWGHDWNLQLHLQMLQHRPEVLVLRVLVGVLQPSGYATIPICGAGYS